MSAAPPLIDQEPLPFSLCMENTLYVFSFRMVCDHGLDFFASAYYVSFQSINQSINQKYCTIYCNSEGLQSYILVIAVIII